MPSRFDTQLADEWTRGFGEFKETWIRRIGGDPEKTESVEVISEFDSGASGGLVRDENGEYVQVDGRIEVAAAQATTPEDTWVNPDGPFAGVFKQVGQTGDGDAASKTLSIVCREGIRSRRPRVRR